MKPDATIRTSVVVQFRPKRVAAVDEISALRYELHCLTDARVFRVLCLRDPVSALIAWILVR